MTESSRHYLVIDLALCDLCHTPGHACRVDCSHFDQAGDPDGSCGAMLALREKATFELVCRRCEHASCIVACPFDALERTDEGIIKRHNLRCVSCKSCAIACPFGTIYGQLLPFYNVSYEAGCRSCLAGLDPQGETAPACAGSCKEGAIEWRTVAEGEDDVRIIDEVLAVRASDRARAWDKTGAAA